MGMKSRGASNLRSGAISEQQAARQQAVIEEHNELRKLMGLPPVKNRLTADASLTVNAKLGKIHTGRSAAQVLDILYQGEGASPPRGRYIHWWGQFSDELPIPFKLPGGHGCIEARDLRHATLLFRGLRDSVLAMKPNAKSKRTKEWAGITAHGMVWYRWMLQDGRQMTVEFRSRSQLTPSLKHLKMRRPQ